MDASGKPSIPQDGTNSRMGSIIGARIRIISIRCYSWIFLCSRGSGHLRPRFEGIIGIIFGIEQSFLFRTTLVPSSRGAYRLRVGCSGIVMLLFMRRRMSGRGRRRRAVPSSSRLMSVSRLASVPAAAFVTRRALPTTIGISTMMFSFPGFSRIWTTEQ